MNGGGSYERRIRVSCSLHSRGSNELSHLLGPATIAELWPKNRYFSLNSRPGARSALPRTHQRAKRAPAYTAAREARPRVHSSARSAPTNTELGRTQTRVPNPITGGLFLGLLIDAACGECRSALLSLILN